ncbi:MAG: GNAT family N-acetyltransferase [Streptococcaceae bacterium]|jgi:ribosomal-protein-alanine N-acetyltransferase|nr:GNAT family N-acetyltransferase [Streptococcaceae bacterium]
MTLDEQLATFNIIETERLLLRPFLMTDAPDMFAYASRPENLVYVFPAHQTLAETRTAIATLFMKAPLGKWAIEHKADGRMIGTIGFGKRDDKKRAVEIGYVLNQMYWGQGLMTEAVRTLAEMSLTTFGLYQVDIVVDVDNIGSQQVAEKSGFRLQESYKALNPYTKVLRKFKRYRKTLNGHRSFMTPLGRSVSVGQVSRDDKVISQKGKR